MTDKSDPKAQMGAKKDLIHLVPAEAIRGISKAMKYGARDAKRADGGSGYGDYNWRETKVRLTVYLDAIMRHTLALMDKEDLDNDSGLPHEYHIGANIAIITDAKKYGCLIDDRPKTPTYGTIDPDLSNCVDIDTHLQNMAAKKEKNQYFKGDK